MMASVAGYWGRLLLKAGGLVRNCWFCNEDQRVPWAHRDSWTCKQCQQYNGFNSDGGYNKDIPEMHKESTYPRPGKESADAKNGLCKSCNMHQELKRYQLATFQPSKEDLYDQEVEEYAKHLERTYRLCRRCEATLHQKLGEQESWLKVNLLAWKVELSRLTASKSAQILRKNLQERRRPLLLTAVVFAAALLANLHIISNDISRSDLSSKLRTLGQAMGLSLFDFVYLVYAFIAGVLVLFPREALSGHFTLTLTFWSLLLGLCVNAYYGSSLLTECRELIPIVASALIPTALIEPLVLGRFSSSKETAAKSQRSSQKPCADEHNSSRSSPALTQDLLTESVCRTTTQSVRSGLDGNLLNGSELSLTVGAEDAFETSTRLFPKATPAASKSSLSLAASLQQPNWGNSSGKCDISRLSIQGSGVSDNGNSDAYNTAFENSLFTKPTTASPPRAFVRKDYNTHNKSGINFGNSSVLRPARFNPAKSSWVAGGYWQSPHNDSTLLVNNAGALPPQEDSRPSSKSSGFISSSEAVLARSPSIHQPDPRDLNRSLLFSRYSQCSRVSSSEEDAISQFSQALMEKKPKAQSSPRTTMSECYNKAETPAATAVAASAASAAFAHEHWLDKRVSISLFHLVLGASLAVNFSFAWIILRVYAA